MINHSLIRAPLFALFALAPVALLAVDAPAASPPTPAPRQVPMRFGMNPLTWANYIRTPNARHPHLSFYVDGEGAGGVRAARIIITRAVDDTGRELQGPANPAFFRIAVGSVSGADYTGPIPPKIECDLSAVAPEAKTLKIVEGRVELVIPAMHPDAVAMIATVPAHTGAPIDSEALRKAGITLEIYDRRTYDARMSTYQNQSGGFAEYGVGVFFPPSMLTTMPPEARAGLQKMADEQLKRDPLPQLTDRDLALALTDPGQRLVGFEFIAGDTPTLTYNRNGWAHYESTAGKRLDIFRLGTDIPVDLKLVCWLAIDKSLAVIPLQLNDVPLPPAMAPLPKPAAPPTASDVH
jgi:hypothetical protein